MSALEIISVPLGVIWIVITYLFAGMFAMSIEESDCKNKWVLSIKELICELFSNRNIFGFILSIIVLVIILPAILIILITQVLSWLLMLFGLLWKFGDTK